MAVPSARYVRYAAQLPPDASMSVSTDAVASVWSDALASVSVGTRQARLGLRRQLGLTPSELRSRATQVAGRRASWAELRVERARCDRTGSKALRRAVPATGPRAGPLGAAPGRARPPRRDALVLHAMRASGSPRVLRATAPALGG